MSHIVRSNSFSFKSLCGRIGFGDGDDASPARSHEAAVGRRDRARILEAALGVFAERGFDGAATCEIASRAGVTQGLLRYHFDSKDDLWRAAVDDLFAALNRALFTRAEGLRGVDELTASRLLIREFVYFSARRPELYRIVTGEGRAKGPRLEWLAERHARPLHDATTAMFARLAELGHVPALPPAHAYYVLTGDAATIFVLAPECRCLAGVDPTTDDVIEAHADAVTTLIFGPDRTSTARPT